MMQVLLVLTSVFVAWVVYEVFKAASQSGNSPAAESPPAGLDATPAAVFSETPAEPPAAVEPAAPEIPESSSPPPMPGAEIERPAQFRNPSTGEISAIPTNYRFAKRWIKEALVAEGLLERIYKPGELDEANSRKVKEALEKLKGMEKYQG